MSPVWTFKHTLYSVLASVIVVALAAVSAPLCLPLELSCFVAILPLTWMAYRQVYYAWPGLLYYFVFALFLFREFAIMLRHELPCGLCTYVSKCEQPTSTRNGGGCAKWAFDLKEDSCRATTTDMDWGSMWAGVPPAIAAMLVLAMNLWRWNCAKLEPWAMAQVNVILFLPTTYVVCSLYSLRLLTVNRSDLWTPKAVFDIGDLYTAVSLFAFEQLVTKIVEVKRRKQLDQLQNDKMKGFENLGNRLMQLGCYPYVFLCFCANFMEITMKEFVDFWLPEICTEHIPDLVHTFFPSLVGFELDPKGSFDAFKGHHGSYACKEVWGALELPIGAMNFLVCSIAVTCIVIYEQAMEHSLESIKPKMKFIAVKGLLMVIFWQDIILGVLISDAWMKARVNSFMLIWEAFLLGVLQWFAYNPDDFVIVQEEPAVIEPPKPKTTLGRLNEAFWAPFGGNAAAKENGENGRGWTSWSAPESSKTAPQGGGVTMEHNIDYDYTGMDNQPDRGCTSDACVIS